MLWGIYYMSEIEESTIVAENDISAPSDVQTAILTPDEILEKIDNDTREVIKRFAYEHTGEDATDDDVKELIKTSYSEALEKGDTADVFLDKVNQETKGLKSALEVLENHKK